MDAKLSAPRESSGSNDSGQLSVVHEALSSLTEVLKRQAEPKPRPLEIVAKDEAATLAALTKAAPVFSGDVEEYY